MLNYVYVVFKGEEVWGVMEQGYQVQLFKDNNPDCTFVLVPYIKPDATVNYPKKVNI